MNNALPKYSYLATSRADGERALNSLYHNATPYYPKHEEESDFELFDMWFEDSSNAELNFLNSFCIRNTSYDPNAAWKHISNYGEVLLWGRGGRTVAPKHLVNDTYIFGTPLIHCDVHDLCLHDLVRMTEIVDSFNAYVGAWCQGVSDRWTEYHLGETK